MHWTYFVPYLVIVGGICLRFSQLHEPLVAAMQTTLARLAIMHLASASVFLHVSLAAGHHHPDVWHAGDPLPEVPNSKKVDKSGSSTEHGMDWVIMFC